MDNDQQGSILIYTLIVMSLLCIIATSTFARSLDDYKADSALADRIQSHYLAEAGVAYARARFSEEPFVPCATGRVALIFPDGLLPPGFTIPEVHMERAANGHWQIVSVGRAGVGRQTVRVPLD
jgi:Na+-transporting NADH:ubiquinone oxidoreductase subunit NqrC